MSLLARISETVRLTPSHHHALAPAAPGGAANQLSRLSLELCREAGARYVRVLIPRGECKACQGLAGRQYQLADAPPLPPVKCACAAGCRCCYTPVG